MKPELGNLKEPLTHAPLPSENSLLGWKIILSELVQTACHPRNSRKTRAKAKRTLKGLDRHPVLPCIALVGFDVRRLLAIS